MTSSSSAGPKGCLELQLLLFIGFGMVVSVTIAKETRKPAKHIVFWTTVFFTPKYHLNLHLQGFEPTGKILLIHC
ncbi:hypothetical protein HanRHA438_Chr17g0799071 [Helianthus annuus]|nr:hypothetical protein HanRHA438_Chr17g0799071 [Helianthus annuus]